MSDFQEVNQLQEHNQSAYKKRHSIETALLRVYSYILYALDNGDIMCHDSIGAIGSI